MEDHLERPSTCSAGSALGTVGHVKELLPRCGIWASSFQAWSFHWLEAILSSSCSLPHNHVVLPDLSWPPSPTVDSDVSAPPRVLVRSTGGRRRRKRSLTDNQEEEKEEEKELKTNRPGPVLSRMSLCPQSRRLRGRRNDSWPIIRGSGLLWRHE